MEKLATGGNSSLLEICMSKGNKRVNKKKKRNNKKGELRYKNEKQL